MLDIVLIREKPELVRAALLDRNDDPARVDAILALDEQRRDVLQEVEALRAERNRVSKEIGRIKLETSIFATPVVSLRCAR